MKLIKYFLFFFILLSLNNNAFSKDPSALINEIVDEAALILSSEDPVESKIIKLNAIAERSVDINGIGMYTLGKYRKQIDDDQKSKYKRLFRSYFLKSFSSRLVDYTNPKINVISQKKLMINIRSLIACLKQHLKDHKLKLIGEFIPKIRISH